ncbi:MAG: T9SS type A sorting domain-containing protein [Dysgonamonadaceae bacterium]|jgi:poly(3-hydroxybutyrate) depolymerase|nr:T9SS type A sorting domain-containing protein [Dysgonamonadaceae bacterium]
MKNYLVFISFMMLFSPLLGQNASSVFLYDTIRTSDGGELLYRKLTPLNAVEGEKYPLVLFLHGAGQRGSDNVKQLELGGDLFANTANRQNFPAYVLAPQCPADNYWAYGTRPTQFGNATFPGNYSIVPIMVRVKELLDSYLSRPDIDLERVYIVGLSMGALGTYDMACRFPEIFAAAVPICGGVNVNRLVNVENIYWRLYHGALDPTVPVANSREIYQHLLGLDAEAEYVEYPNIQHEAWGPAFNSADFLSWIFGKTKKTPDSEIIQIFDAEGLNNVRNNPTGSFKLMNDIDLTETLQTTTDGWSPIPNFAGKFNGNGKTISGLWINRSASDNLGLFGTVAGDAEIRNLGIVAGDIVGNNNVTALLGKILAGNVKISGCFVNANLTGKINVAGIVANSEGFVKIENCYSAGSFHALSGGDRVGGILGRAGGANAIIDKCYSTAAILNEGTPSAGGIAGSNANKITISNCAAVNPYLNGAAGSFTPGRILSYSTNDTFVNNIAFDGITSNQALGAGTATNKNGASKSGYDLAQQATFATTLGWDFTGIWEMGNGCYPLPVLRRIDKNHQPGSVLNHLVCNVAITTNAGAVADGTISPSQTVGGGSDVTIQIVPNSGFIVNRLYINGEDRASELVENDGTFEISLPCVWEDQTISVYFKSANPTEIFTAQDLNNIRNNTETEDYKLMNNIDLTEFLSGQAEGWQPINNFTGSFDGNGKVISGLRINRSGTDNIGLFGNISGLADIRDLGVIVNLVSGKNNVGGLVGKVSAGGNVTISGSFVQGDIFSTEKNIGGIVGATASTLKIENCYSTGTVHGSTGSDRVGGILGFANATDVAIDRCYSIASIWNEGSPSAAGICGSNDNKITISNCAAINPTVDGKTTSYFSATRILCWEGSAVYNNNIAFDKLLANGSVISSGSLWNKNGADRTKEQLRKQETYDTNSLGWNFNTLWTMGNANYPLPVLTKIDAAKQPSLCPAHLQIETKIKPLNKNDLTIFPNPTSGELFISGKPENQIMEIFDITGKKQMQSIENKINISNFTNGVYFCKTENRIIKIIKQ